MDLSAHRPLSQKIVPSNSLVDPFGRAITYLRLSVTDRCNLRCLYCLPEAHVKFQPLPKLLDWEELARIVRIFTQLGVTKLRITGGEPFLRKGLMEFLCETKKYPSLQGVYLTTNGVRTKSYLERLKGIGINGINLSLDTLRRERFRMITQRDVLDHVLDTFYRALELGIPLKINTVIQEGFNSDEIESLARLTEKHPVEVRFIEEMPQLSGKDGQANLWNFERILTVLRSCFPDLIPLPLQKSSTARRFTIPGFVGKIGIIAGHSRLFCASCNRIRVTATGMMKTCLYDNGVLDLKQLLRDGADDSEIISLIFDAINDRKYDGFSAYHSRGGRVQQTMSSIGG